MSEAKELESKIKSLFSARQMEITDNQISDLANRLIKSCLCLVKMEQDQQIIKSLAV
jgi:hypothetical protein